MSIDFPPGVTQADLAAALAPMSTGLAAIPKTRVLYTSTTAETIVTGANTRISMLVPSAQASLASFVVPANALPIGASLLLMGTGLIGARLTTPPGFNLVPWVTPAGGSKTDLPGFAQAPLLGADGFCEIWLRYTQTAAGIRTAGVTRYGTQGGMAYSITINPGTVSTQPSVVASDSTVDRTFGCDGFWGFGADTREYVRSRDIQVLLCPVSG